ncbi:MAG: nucleotidyltransferase domain-containing protein [Candidatus Desantisbacteria bacterium]
MKQISNQIIDEIIKRIIECANPVKIILFGSFVRGEQTEESDIDLLVIEDNVMFRRKEMIKIRRALQGYANSS